MGDLEVHVVVDPGPPHADRTAEIPELIGSAEAARAAGCSAWWLDARHGGNPFGILGYVARRVPGIGLGAVGCDPWVWGVGNLARMTASLDRVSAGRAGIGLLGPAENLVDAARVLRALFTGEPVTADVGGAALSGAVCRPTPLDPERVRIVVEPVERLAPLESLEGVVVWERTGSGPPAPGRARIRELDRRGLTGLGGGAGHGDATDGPAGVALRIDASERGVAELVMSLLGAPLPPR